MSKLHSKTNRKKVATFLWPTVVGIVGEYSTVDIVNLKSSKINQLAPSHKCFWFAQIMAAFREKLCYKSLQYDWFLFLVPYRSKRINQSYWRIL